MKKLISVFVLAIMAASVLLAVAGCSDNSALLAEIEELKDRVEDLENKNNVFWTDKAEYAEDETMTVYFKNTAVFEVSLDFESLHGTAFWDTGSGTGVNGAVFYKKFGRRHIFRCNYIYILYNWGGGDLCSHFIA